MTLPTTWTPIAVRQATGHDYDVWHLLETAPMDTQEAARLRGQGLLLTAHRHSEGRIELVVKQSKILDNLAK